MATSPSTLHSQVNPWGFCDGQERWTDSHEGDGVDTDPPQVVFDHPYGYDVSLRWCTVVEVWVRLTRTEDPPRWSLGVVGRFRDEDRRGSGVDVRETCEGVVVTVK